MNRFELLLIALVLIVTVIFLVKSRWFDRMIDSLMRGSRPKDVTDLRTEAERLNANKTTISQEIDCQAEKAKKDRREIRSL